MSIKVAFMTTIFPMEKEYLFDFFNSLKKQTYKKFDVIVVNDGYNTFEEIKDAYKELNIIELEYSNTPAKNREFGIKYIKNNNYDVLIFGDSDDYFEKNRVRICVDKLNNYEIVINDLSLFNESGVYSRKYISNRIKHNTEIDLTFIKDKNIFGMSNTAMKTRILEEIDFNSELIAVDWYLFSILLLKNNKAIFTNKTETFYRQYSSNMIGIGNISDESILKGITVKIKHYELLQEKKGQFKSLYNEMIQLQKKIIDKKYIAKLKEQTIPNPLWWENIRLIG